jgi:hypothetical protein
VILDVSKKRETAAGWRWMTTERSRIQRRVAATALLTSNCRVCLASLGVARGAFDEDRRTAVIDLLAMAPLVALGSDTPPGRRLATRPVGCLRCRRRHDERPGIAAAP